MKNRSLIAYFMVLTSLCAGFIVGARMLGQQDVYLAGGYMLTPAMAALITRLFFHESRFKDAGLRFARFRDYVKFWLYSLGITGLSFILKQSPGRRRARPISSSHKPFAYTQFVFRPAAHAGRPL
jgi:hypothetical protein